MGTRAIPYVAMLTADDDAGCRRTSAATGAAGYHVHPTSRAWEEDFPSCTCPDFTERRILCKHILFVLWKILHLTPPITRDMINKAYVLDAVMTDTACAVQQKSGAGADWTDFQTTMSLVQTQRFAMPASNAQHAAAPSSEA